jgi:hypothetical protein
MCSTIRRFVEIILLRRIPCCDRGAFR